MSTQQPVWKCIANLGDRSPIEYGGFFVYVDETGVYPPEVELLEAPDSDDSGDPWVLYRFILDRCTLSPAGILSDNKFHPEISAWFADDLPRVADCVDYPIDELMADLCSSDPLKLAPAYRAIGEYHGFENFDSYPQSFKNRFRIERFARKYRAQWAEV